MKNRKTKYRKYMKKKRKTRHRKKNKKYTRKNNRKSRNKKSQKGGIGEPISLLMASVPFAYVCSSSSGDNSDEPSPTNHVQPRRRESPPSDSSS